MIPAMALQFLIGGNRRIRRNLRANSDLSGQVNATRDGQFSFATNLSCIDPWVSLELRFDHCFRDIFSNCVAGYFMTEVVPGSLAFACKIPGSKLLVGLGHTSCGAIIGLSRQRKDWATVTVIIVRV